MRMILDDKYDIIDNYMSDSNVGGRREGGFKTPVGFSSVETVEKVI